MTKSNGPPRKSKTHFEQVPVELAKKIAAQEAPKDKKAGPARPTAEPASKKD